MNMYHLTPDQVPASLRGNYAGRKFRVQVHNAESMHISDAYHTGGGTFSRYTAVNLATGDSTAVAVDAGNPFVKPDGQTVKFYPNMVIVEHSHFCGKDMGLTFHVQPDMMPRLLPDQSGDDLNRHHRIVLIATRSLKSSYAGVSNYRFHEAKRVTGISPQQWEVAKAELIERKLLNKAGAITPAGRNAAGSDSLYSLKD